MKEDPTFKERFGISTPIIYSHDVIVEPKWKEKYDRAWKRFCNLYEPSGSLVRRKRFDALLKRVEELGDDLPFTKLIEIRHINKKVGFGVFAKVDIPRNCLLNHYGGLLRPDKAIADNNDSTFMFEHFKSFSIDAQTVGNWCRFMNHCDDKHPASNVVAWEHYSDWGPRILFTAGPKGIKKGAQLLYSYGESYWEGDGFLELN